MGEGKQRKLGGKEEGENKKEFPFAFPTGPEIEFKAQDEGQMTHFTFPLSACDQELLVHL